MKKLFSSRRSNKIVIDILTIGDDYLRLGRKIELDDLRVKLKEKGYDKSLIENSLSLFFPENFKNYYNEGSWLSSDGHIRLLQYKSLRRTTQTITVAIVIGVVSIISSLFIQPMLNKKDNKNNTLLEQSITKNCEKQDSIISLLRKNVDLKESINNKIDSLVTKKSFKKREK